MKRRIRVPDDYIPVDCRREAKEFFVMIRDDVEIYKKFKCLPNMKQSEEADKFVAWWDLERFAECPLSLILIHDNLDEINNRIGNYDVLDGYGQLQFKLIQFYSILKENGMIHD